MLQREKDRKRGRMKGTSSVVQTLQGNQIKSRSNEFSCKLKTIEFRRFKNPQFASNGAAATKITE